MTPAQTTSTGHDEPTCPVVPGGSVNALTSEQLDTFVFTGDALIAINHDQQIEIFNHDAEIMFGYTSEEDVPLVVEVAAGGGLGVHAARSC